MCKEPEEPCNEPATKEGSIRNENNIPRPPTPPNQGRTES